MKTIFNLTLCVALLIAVLTFATRPAMQSALFSFVADTEAISWRLHNYLDKGGR